MGDPPLASGTQWHVLGPGGTCLPFSRGSLLSESLLCICCPQRRETKADTLKQLRPIGEGDQELEKRLDQEELT
jgi:hypothetical protein